MAPDTDTVTLTLTVSEARALIRWLNDRRDHEQNRATILDATIRRDIRRALAREFPHVLAGTCPYCFAPYTLAAGGCEDACQTSQTAARLVADAIAADEKGLIAP